MTVQVSVVVPTFNRPDLLRNCLEALLDQDFPAEAYEVVVADNAAGAETRLLVESFSDPRLHYIPAAEKPGPAAARNAGWRSARGTLVAFTDDDCLPEPDWLREGVSALQYGFDAVTGRIIVPVPRVPTDYERNVSKLATEAEFLTANCFIRCSVLHACGGFDERYATAWREDSDLHFRLMEGSYKIGIAPAARVVHPARRAPWGISLAEQRKSMFNALLSKKHPRLYRERIQRTPPLQYYAIVLAAIAALVLLSAGQFGLASVLIAVWAVLTADFAVRRLRGTTHSASHVAEMILTSMLIPFLSVFWRIYGAIKFRAWFL